MFLRFLISSCPSELVQANSDGHLVPVEPLSGGERLDYGAERAEARERELLCCDVLEKREGRDSRVLPVREKRVSWVLVGSGAQGNGPSVAVSRKGVVRSAGVVATTEVRASGPDLESHTGQGTHLSGL